jgi:hypothetical protein
MKPAKKAPQAKPQAKAAKPRRPAAPAVVPLARILCNPKPLVAPRHTGGVNLEALPVEAWPAPSPAELATVAAACGWMNQPDGPARAMKFLWNCAEVIHESRQSAARFLAAIRGRGEWTAGELRKACGFAYQELPDKISHADFLALFNTERLQVRGETLRGRALFDYWHSLPEGVGVPLDQADAWHASFKDGFECSRFSFSERWEILAWQVAAFNEWRKGTARQNNPGKKNLRRGVK